MPIKINNSPLNYFVFSGGEIQVKLRSIIQHMGPNDPVHIVADIHNSEEVMALVMLKDVFDNMGFTDVSLRMPYVPYARQDRVCDFGEAMSIRAFTKIINSLNFKSVTIWDPHSDVTPALLNNCRVESQEELVRQTLLKSRVAFDINNIVVIAPDAGASKKAHNVAKYIKSSTVLQAIKHRDVSTGNITNTSIQNFSGHDYPETAHFLVVDDICDGGRTFSELAKVVGPKLLTTQKLGLYVTHGIFSKGPEPLKDYDYVLSPNSWIESIDNIHSVKILGAQ